jgi:hypothetical protein
MHVLVSIHTEREEIIILTKDHCRSNKEVTLGRYVECIRSTLAAAWNAHQVVLVARVKGSHEQADATARDIHLL